MVTAEAAMLEISMGRRNGVTRTGALPSARGASESTTSIPPSAVAMVTPTRSVIWGSGGSRASVTAGNGA